MTICDTAIVGAGPYGLSIAAHLKAASIPFQIFGTPLESWRAFMPEGMVLKSEPFASNLWDPARHFTLERFSHERKLPYQASGTPLSLADFLVYAEWFQERAVGNVENLRVSQITTKGSSFELQFVGGARLQARRVVLANGHMDFRHIPAELTNLPEPLCLHSSRMGNPSGYAGRDVIVVGAGQSALESAALLHEAGATVRLIARTAKLEWNRGAGRTKSLLNRVAEPESGLGHGWRSLAVSELPQVFRRLFPLEKRHRFVASSWGPSGSWWLRPRFEGSVTTLLGQRILSAAAVDGRVRLILDGPSGTTELTTDHVIAGTGYKIDIERLGCLEPALRSAIVCERAVPVLSANFETSVPGLFVAGIASAPTFGPVMRFMFGAKHAAPAVARQLKR